MDDDLADNKGDKLPPWMEPLSPEARESVRRIVAAAPPFTERQRERLRLLFRKPG